MVENLRRNSIACHANMLTLHASSVHGVPEESLGFGVNRQMVMHG